MDLTRFGRPTSGLYTLLAFGQGKQWSLKAQDLGDWYDLESTLAFLNGLALHIGSETTFVSLATGDQNAVVLARERGAVLTATREGLIQPTDGGESAAAGKAAEDAVLEQLMKETR